MALIGTLEDMGLNDLLEILKSGRRTGVLTITFGANSGVIFVASGRPVDAALLNTQTRDVHASGEDALMLLLSWAQGSFAFRNSADSALRSVQITRSTTELHRVAELRRAATERNATTLLRRAVEQRRVATERAESILDADTVLILTADRVETERIQLSIDQWQVLSQITSGRSFSELCQQIGSMTQRRVALVVESLVKAGLVMPQGHIQPLSEQAVGA